MHELQQVAHLENLLYSGLQVAWHILPSAWFESVETLPLTIQCRNASIHHIR